MDEEIQEQDGGWKPVTIILVVVIGLAAAGIGGGATYWYLSKQDKAKEAAAPSSSKATPSTTKTTDESATTPSTSSKLTNQKFEDGVNASSATVESEIASPVNYVINATECCGEIAAPDASDQLIGYTKDFVPFDFSETNLLVDKIKTNLPDYADHKIGIGTAANRDKLVLMYHLDSSGKVDKIYLSFAELLDVE